MACADAYYRPRCHRSSSHQLLTGISHIGHVERTGRWGEAGTPATQLKTWRKAIPRVRLITRVATASATDALTTGAVPESAKAVTA